MPASSPFKTLKLEVEYSYDFELIGISASIKDYTLAWIFNRTLDIHLIRKEDIQLDLLGKGKMWFSCFVHEYEHSLVKLIKNKSVEFTVQSKPFLLPELKEYDYFLQLEGDFAYHCNEKLEKVKSLREVQFAKLIEIENIASKQNLLN